MRLLLKCGSNFDSQAGEKQDLIGRTRVVTRRGPIIVILMYTCKHFTMSIMLLVRDPFDNDGSVDACDAYPGTQARAQAELDSVVGTARLRPSLTMHTYKRSPTLVLSRFTGDSYNGK